MKLAARLAPRSFSLHTKLMLAFTVLVMLVAFASAYILVEKEREHRLHELEDRATRIAELYSRSLAQPLWNVDVGAIESQLGALSPNPEVAQFIVTATNYGIVSTTNGAPLPPPDERIVRVKPIEFTPPGDAPREKIGEIRVVLTRAVAEAGISRARDAILAMMSTVVLLICVATFFLLKRLVRSPISRLEEMVDRIAGGDFDARCAIEADDEVGRLAMRVNAMADRLRVSTSDLRDSERKYRRIVEDSLEGIFRLDESGTLDEANPAMAELLGYDSASELIRCAADDPRQRPFSPTRTRSLFDILRMQGAVAGLELQLRRVDGTPIWVQLNARRGWR